MVAEGVARVAFMDEPERDDLVFSANFACPVCSADLRSKANPDFAELFIDAPDKKPKRVLFSRKHGTHATFIEKGDVFAGYGEDVEDFERTNFFGS